MNTSDRIPAKKVLSEADNLEWVRKSLSESSGLSLKSFCERVCGHFGFLNSRDESQTGGCALALRALESRGLISLQSSPGYRPTARGAWTRRFSSLPGFRKTQDKSGSSGLSR